MAFGKHWEWRGFGEVSEAFIERYSQLERGFGPLRVRDLYVWAPGLQVNIKIRKGELGGLKFKRMVDRYGRFECWSEDPAELFEFPLQEEGWQTLAGELAVAGAGIGSYPREAPDSDRLVSILEEAGCLMVAVSKERGGRLWQGANGCVLVERTTIHKPQPILSIGLESEDTASEGEGLTDEQAKVDLRAAIKALNLDREALVAMNYSGAVALWTKETVINF